MEKKLIKVRATTHAKRESLRVVSADTLAISVKEKPERNLANERIIELVASHFNLPIKKVHFIKGQHSPSKTFSIDIGSV